MKKDLLEAMAEAAGYHYISDLPRIKGGYPWKKCLTKISEGEYNLEQWLEAVRYITGEKATEFKNEKEVRNYLTEKFM